MYSTIPLPYSPLWNNIIDRTAKTKLDQKSVWTDKSYSSPWRASCESTGSILEQTNHVRMGPHYIYFHRCSAVGQAPVWRQTISRYNIALLYFVNYIGFTRAYEAPDVKHRWLLTFKEQCYGIINVDKFQYIWDTNLVPTITTDGFPPDEARSSAATVLYKFLSVSWLSLIRIVVGHTFFNMANNILVKNSWHSKG